VPSPAPPRLPSLGPRGEGWVVAQVILIALLAAAGIWGPRWPGAAGPWRQLLGWPVGLLGLALAVAAGLGLGRQLTPLPRPVEGGRLRDQGAYALARHPMYGGVLLLVLAWALLTSPLALLPAAAAAPFLAAKLSREEAWLRERYPGYDGYQRRVRWRLVPFVW
jgi:protein-S-isoprenylcysteine O-methyltransferase Ste14